VWAVEGGDTAGCEGRRGDRGDGMQGNLRIKVAMGTAAFAKIGSEIAWRIPLGRGIGRRHCRGPSALQLMFVRATMPRTPLHVSIYIAFPRPVCASMLSYYSAHNTDWQVHPVGRTAHR
jgi:hypothetical protein